MHFKLIYLVLSYLSGSVPYGFIFVKIFKGEDIRKFGSGNIGATNVFRFDKKLGILTLFFDLSKAFFPTFFALKLFSFDFASLVAFLTVLGHITSPFFLFKGGKGVATLFGAFLALIPFPILIGAIVFVAVILLFRMVSLGSLSASLTILIVSIFVESYPLYFDILLFITVFFIFFTHRSNIKRIIEGKERKISFR